MQNHTKQLLQINSSGRGDDSVSRQLSAELTAELIATLQSDAKPSTVVHRDVAGQTADGSVPFVDAAWIAANFTPAEERDLTQREALAYSDALVAELKQADTLVIGVPIYNFSIPASLKAWIDQIARARLTFHYTDKGPRGLLTNKKAYLVVATGGVPVGGPMDFATPYLKQALAFIGISDVEIIAADGLNSNAEESLAKARERIVELTRSGSRTQRNEHV